jgi:hypothetical protein
VREARLMEFTLRAEGRSRFPFDGVRSRHTDRE